METRTVVALRKWGRNNITQAAMAVKPPHTFPLTTGLSIAHATWARSSSSIPHLKASVLGHRDEGACLPGTELHRSHRAQVALQLGPDSLSLREMCAGRSVMELCGGY